MQLNYERKVAVLLHQSDKVISKVRNRAHKDAKEDANTGNLNAKEDGGDSKRIRLDQASSSSSSQSSSAAISEIDSMISAVTQEGEAIFQSILGVSPYLSSSPTLPDTVHSADSEDLSSRSRTSGTIQEVSVKDDVAQFLRKKKTENKKKLAEALSSDYNPLDFMDWTARSL